MTTNKKESRSGVVHFTITGEAITRIARDMWVSHLPKNAIELLLDGLPGITSTQAIRVITGKSKLIGKDEVELVKDNVKYFDPETKSTPLNSPKKLAKVMEEELIEKQMNYLFVLSDRYRNFLTRHNNFSKDNVLKSAQYYGDEVKKISEQLLTLYKYIGKGFHDLPVFNYKMINDLIIEREEYYKKSDADREQLIYEQEQKDKNAFSMEKVLAKRFENAGSGIPGIPEIDVDKFIKQQIKEDNRKTVKPENASKTEWTSGYIDPEGNFFGCADIVHIRFADDLRRAKYFESIIEDSQCALDELGWMKISMNRVLWGPDIESHLTITQKQIDTLFDYMNGKKLKDFLYNGERVTFSEFLKRLE